MKRREAIQSILGLPALAALPELASAQTPPATPSNPIEETPKLATNVPGSVAAGVPRFFTKEQFETLKTLGQILVPSINGRPGATEAHAAEFLDFLLSQSPSSRQTLYKEGLNRLQQDSQRSHSKPFAKLTAAQADSILTPLRESWTYHGPADAFARFLLAAKDDFLVATINSSESAAAGQSRRGAGVGTYWYPVE